MEKEVRVSYQNSVKIVNRSLDVTDKINEIVHRQVCETYEEARKQVNQLIFDLASEQKCSIYDICFNFIPDHELVHKGSPEMPTMVMKVVLKPLKFEFDQGPGFWKQKYYNLKKQMQKLIDSKDDTINEE